MSIEIQISHLLKQHQDPLRVAEELLPSLSTKDQKAFLQFLIASQNYQLAFRCCKAWLSTPKAFPWGSFLQLFYEANLPLMDPDWKAILEGATQSLENAHSLVEFYTEQVHAPPVQQLREKFLKKRKKEWLKSKEDFLKKINYFKQQNMIEEEKKAIEQFQVLFFKDLSTYQHLKEDLKLRWSAHIISKNKIQQNQPLPLKDKEFSPQEEIFLNNILNFFLSLKLNEETAKNSALFFIFQSAHHHALSFLEQIRNHVWTPALSWMFIETLITTKNYVRALGELELMQKQEAPHDPERPFAIRYLKAQCLWGIGKKHKAIQLIREILEVRPDYRSAQTFFNQWTGVTPS
ncbi:MAG: hypothetical protein D6797_06165 [Bdellovibrio sp.]|nr:MAG: hypothetical protein D6797_06165 [Bdellovibrio sp.]